MAAHDDSAIPIQELLERLAQGVAEIERLDEPVRGHVIQFLDELELLHRTALSRLGDELSEDVLERLRAADPALSWLLDAYGVGLDERAEAEAALEPIRPYIHSHGGELEVLDVNEGVVRLKMSGSCSGCTASAQTLTRGVEEALREGFPGFVRIDVEEDEAPAHPPPGPTLLELEDRLA